MAKCVGAGWATRGWFAVVIEDDDWDTDHLPSIWSLWKYHSDADRVLVTVPVGLPAGGRRACDERAKEYLAERRRSLRYAPVRDAVYAVNLDEARALNEPAGFSIQNQTWAVVPRIREVDEFLDSNPGARDRVRETHPELVYRALAGRPLATPRTTAEGRGERRSLLREEYPPAADIIEAAVERYTRPSYAPMISDGGVIVDVVAAAVTARRDPDRVETIPPVPPTDERGLPMGITRPVSTEQARLPVE